jgi:hypothetical protein
MTSKFKTGIMRNKLKWTTSLRQMKLRWPIWLWIMMATLAFSAISIVSWRTMNHRAAFLPAGVIRASPFLGRQRNNAIHREDAWKGLTAIRNWRRWMDSLRTTAGGLIIYDSILRTRPGLLDSASRIENYYLQQLK